jgi:methylglutaconyl-CoA hydratase
MLAMRQRLDATLEPLLDDLLACGPGAQREAKALVRALAFRPITDALIEETAAMIARIRAAPEAREGLSAFLEKRDPLWRKD